MHEYCQQVSTTPCAHCLEHCLYNKAVERAVPRPFHVMRELRVPKSEIAVCHFRKHFKPEEKAQDSRTLHTLDTPHDADTVITSPENHETCEGTASCKSAAFPVRGHGAQEAGTNIAKQHGKNIHRAQGGNPQQEVRR